MCCRRISAAPGPDPKERARRAEMPGGLLRRGQYYALSYCTPLDGAFGARTAEAGSGGHGRARATARHHSDSSWSSRGSRFSCATRKSSAASSRRLMASTCFSRSVSSDISILLSCWIARLCRRPSERDPSGHLLPSIQSVHMEVMLNTPAGLDEGAPTGVLSAVRKVNIPRRLACGGRPGFGG